MKNLIYLLLLLLAGACNESDFADKILDQKPENAVASSNFWQTEEDVASASNELHVRLRTCFSQVARRVYRDRGLIFDYVGNTMKNASNNELEKSWNITSANISWELEYNIISQANQILEFVDNADIPQERKDFYRGEALTVRAWTYFYIIRTWGDAPLLTNAFESEMQTAIPWPVIARYIIRDLKEAYTLLPRAGALANKQIPSCGTVNAILAHVCAWTGSLNNEPELLKEGIKAASEVITGGDYELAASPSEVCTVVLKGNSPESIFELQFSKNELEQNGIGSCLSFLYQKFPCVPNTTEGTKRRDIRISNEMAKQFFNTCGSWFDEIFYEYDKMAALPQTTNQGAAYIWKFRDFTKHESGTSMGLPKALDQNEILIRLADIILLRAEMYARIGETDKAISDLNVIRERCGAALYSPAEGDLSEAIFHQREQELFLEGISIRYYDIVRHGIGFIRKKLPGRFKEIQSLDEAFLPYHQNAFLLNPALKQNIWGKYVQFRK